MAETFMILERAGNGYLVKSTEGRGDQEQTNALMRVAIHAPGPPDAMLALDSFFDISYDLEVTGARIKTPSVGGPGTIGGHHGSTTGTIRQVATEFNPDTGTWWVFLDYIFADPSDDMIDIQLTARKHELSGHVTLIK